MFFLFVFFFVVFIKKKVNPKDELLISKLDFNSNSFILVC